MSEPIKVGDPVMLVWACCASGRKFIGWTGKVEAITDARSICGVCRNVYQGRHGWITIEQHGCVPMPWLKKLDPDAEQEHEQHREEVHA